MSLQGNQPFEVLYAGRLDPSRVSVKWVDPPPVSSELEKEVQAHWIRSVSESGNKHLFDGEVAGLERWRAHGARLHLRLFPLRYRYVWYRYGLAALAKKDVGHEVPSALGISAVVTSGEYVLLMLRSDRVAEYPGRYDVFGGHIERDESGKWLSPAQGILREVSEELGVEEELIRLGSCLGLIRTIATKKPELVFTADLSPATAGGAVHAPNAEVKKILQIPKDHVERMVTEDGDRLTPSAFGSLWLWFRANGLKEPARN